MTKQVTVTRGPKHITVTGYSIKPITIKLRGRCPIAVYAEVVALYEGIGVVVNKHLN